MEINSFSLRIATKWVGFLRRWQMQEAKRFTAEATPELLLAYDAFSKANQSGSPRQPFKGRDLWRILTVIQPTSIVELGSGTTSAVFALWSSRHGAAYTAFEHHEGWAKVTSQCLEKAGVVQSAGAGVICVETWLSEDSSTVGFQQPLPADVELVYVDGPPCVLEDGRKVPNDDVIRLLDRGIFPKAIVVDGRIETVDLILQHPASTNFAFQPGLAYCVRKNLFFPALSGLEHSIFIRK